MDKKGDRNNIFFYLINTEIRFYKLISMYFFSIKKKKNSTSINVINYRDLLARASLTSYGNRQLRALRKL